MEKIIETIIEIEEKAQKICADAVERKENFAQTLDDEIDQMTREIAERVQRRIALIDEQEQAYAQEAVEKNQKRYEAQMQQMNELFRQNEKQWEDEAFARIITP